MEYDALYEDIDSEGNCIFIIYDEDGEPVFTLKTCQDFTTRNDLEIGDSFQISFKKTY